MEPPPVQDATTKDGVSIAWAGAGHGTPLLCHGPTPAVAVGQAGQVNVGDRQVNVEK
jgi:hypothetical protein